MSQVIHSDNRYKVSLNFRRGNSNTSPTDCLINQVTQFKQIKIISLLNRQPFDKDECFYHFSLHQGDFQSKINYCAVNLSLPNGFDKSKGDSGRNLMEAAVK
ncbi:MULTISPECIES: hypothetical protein [Xenorhabdus]|uniref:hypothetical protein n=1 Tax=Xenorhabdus TaxID=626 RepID=UPI00064B3F22|nr:MULTISPECIES: hypothetical protein [Xenorhabdus]KLU15482.1 hypothetical protein AAY47_10760 [Xenorhabdus griffiniae]KOP34960.1 hypothetical protein AFK69_02490 [Xenorhabdus sp. GDc328]